MKKLSLLILLFLSFFLQACTNDTKTPDVMDRIRNENKIKIGVKTDSRPFGFIKDDKIQGFDVDVAAAIAERLFEDEIQAEFVPLESSQRIMALNTGKVDIVVATFSINDKRKEIVDFTVPYFVAGQALMVKDNSKITAINRLNDKTIAIVLGTTGEKTARMLAPGAATLGSATYKKAFEYLKDGTVDAILADDSLLYGLIAETKGYKILPTRYTKEYYAVGLKKGEENLKLKLAINSILTSMQDTGELNRIKEKWMPRN